MIAAIYSRKSMFTEKGDSILNQVQMCKDYAEKIDISDFIIYEDEGFSGKNTERPEFQKMLKDGKANKFQVLICYRLDRISRNIADFSSLIERLQELQIGFISIREQFDTTTPMGRAMMYIASVFAQLERETIAERIRDNMLELAKSGRWLGGQTPLGFGSEKISFLDAEFNERTMHKLSPIGEELDLVKIIYDKYTKTQSISSTLKYLLSNNLKGKNGGDYASMSINDILRNPVYVQSTEPVLEYLRHQGIKNICGSANGNGILIYNKRDSKFKAKDVSEWIAAVSKHKGILSAEQWLNAQKVLDKNKKKDNPRIGTSKKSLLSGVLKCAHCGAPMRISYGRSKKDGSKGIYYYICTMKAHSGKTRCDNKNVRGDEIEQAVIQNIKQLNTEKILTELRSYKNQITFSLDCNFASKITSEINMKINQINTLLEQLSKTQDPTASEFILSKVENLGQEIGALKVKLNSTEAENKENLEKKLNIDLVEKALEEFNTSFEFIDDIIRKRAILETIVESIYWNGNNGAVDIKLWGSKQIDFPLYI